METPQSHPTAPRSPVAVARDLVGRRVPHILAIYAGASWALVEFSAFAVAEFQLAPHWPRVVLLALFLMVPSVVLLAWFHGRPGKDRDSLARTEKVGIPANLLLCAVVLWMQFGGRNPASATALVTVETEDGETIERMVARTEFKKSTALFPVGLGPGIGENEPWIAYAVPEALLLDLMADDFFVPLPLYRYGWYAEASGRETGGEPSLALRRQLAQGVFAGFLATGEIDRVDGLYRLTLRIHRVDDGTVVGEITEDETDLLALVDAVSGPVKSALEIPARDGIEDLDVRARLSEDAAAVEAYFRSVHRLFAEDDTEGAVEYLTTATTLDPTFTVAQHALSRLLERSGEDETAAIAPLRAAMDNLYRMPERYGFEVKADYYRLVNEMDRAAAVVEMWVELYPNDLDALRARMNWQQSAGDWESVLATVATMQRLDPLDGGLLLETAEAHEELGNDDQAVAALTEYVDRFPGSTFGYYRLSEHHRRRGEHDEARRQLERATLMHPLASEFAADLAEVDLDVGRFGEARTGYERSLELARTPWQRAWALHGLRDYHHRRGEMAEALRAIETRLEEEARSRRPFGIAPGRFEDILVYLDAGRVDRAAAALEELRAQVTPQQRAYYVPHLAVHVTLEAEGVDAALEAHGRALEILEANNIRGPRAALTADLGWILERGGDYSGAAESFSAAIALAPEARFHVGAGRALRKAGLTEDAERELREALRLVPADPRAHLEMALLREDQGDIDAAVESLNRALAVWENADDDYLPAREARARLAALEGDRRPASRE